MANVTRYKTSKGEARYRVRYRKPDGTQTDKRGFKRKIDAENWAAEHVTIAKATNSYVDPEDGKRLVGDLYEQWLKEKWPFWKETTRVNATDSWRLYCEERWTDRRIGTITRAEVQAWISDIIENSGAPSVSRPYQTMLGICRMAVRDKLILDNPCENVELPKLPRRKSRRVYLTISRLLAFADECARGKHLGEERRALVLTLGFCGLRWGEAAALKARDLDFDRGVLHVGGNLVYVGARWVEGTPKNSEERDVPMPLIVMESLKPICGEREPDERVFRDLRGGPIMKQSAAKTTGWWYHALVRLGWPVFGGTAHDVRQCLDYLVRQIDITLVKFTALDAKLDHRAQTAISKVADGIGPFAGIHLYRILQWPEVACAVISFRRRTEIFGTGIMHACERRAEFQCGLGRGGGAVHSLDVEIVFAPVIDLHHTRATLRMRGTQPLQSASFAFEESLRSKSPAFTICTHSRSLQHGCDVLHSYSL